jgi:HAD superfamily hydrolase (TIGR01509 family)
MARPRGVILDVDGTLVDSNDAHARAWVVALAEHGIDVPFDTVRRAIGMGGDKLLPAVAGIEKDSDEGKSISARRAALFKERELPHLRPTPGAADLVARLRRDGFTTTVASSAEKDELDALLRVAGAEALIEAKTSSDDADRSKPDPDIVAAALEKSGVPAAETVMIGDTPYDIEAGARAGVRVIAVRCGGWDDADLAGAVAIYDDPAALLAAFDASPLADA